MPTSDRDAAWLRRFSHLIAAGLALIAVGVLLDPPTWHPKEH